ncbi:uncharacterized protein [Clytia hemisphaerica]|uniref:uncharacterized protein n=1 Tax=Clytia hemisphaerica TaxID=252671 RepID=UPI0034D7AC22
MLHYKRMKRLALMMNRPFLARNERKIWALERHEFWFTDLWDRRDEIDNNVRHSQWRQDFRIKKETFEMLVRLMSPRLAKQDTQLRKAVPIEKRIAIGLWRLATGNAYRTVGKTFGVAKSTAVSITRDFYKELSRISGQVIHFPVTRDETREEIGRFKEETNCKIPQVVGAIDGTHIKITAPASEHEGDYYSRKQCYTINTQAVVGGNLKILDVATGFPGSIHDARVLAHTSLFRKAERLEILTDPTKRIDNNTIRPLLLGDGAYPLVPWLVKPYPFIPALSRSEKRFNKILSSARVTVERGFGILKARWRCLLTRLDAEVENVSDQIIACCVLHNICQEMNDEYIDEDGMLDNILRNERRARQQRRVNQDIYPLGEETRTILKIYLEQNE